MPAVFIGTRSVRVFVEDADWISPMLCWFLFLLVLVGGVHQHSRFAFDADETYSPG